MNGTRLDLTGVCGPAYAQTEVNAMPNVVTPITQPYERATRVIPAKAWPRDSLESMTQFRTDATSAGGAARRVEV
jgi:hypothetical protein